jgi:membrane-bound lytic murein transglycosylase B
MKTKFVLALSLCLAWTPLLVSISRATSVDVDPYAELKRRLTNDGYPALHIQALFEPPPPLQYRLISKTFAIRESKLNYEQFLSNSSLAVARRNLARYASAFERAEQAYRVHRSVIAAILLVETRFGGYTGETPTLAVLSTYALMNQPEHQNRIWALLSGRDQKRWSREAFEKRLLQRSEWAYPEVCALLKLYENQGLRVESLRGSVMGAFGWPQFLPSSLLRYGVDGNGNGAIDLDDPEDAINSVASYLRAHGWVNARTAPQQEEVIHKYNKSTPYVQTVLAIANRLASGD